MTRFYYTLNSGAQSALQPDASWRAHQFGKLRCPHCAGPRAEVKRLDAVVATVGRRGDVDFIWGLIGSCVVSTRLIEALGLSMLRRWFYIGNVSLADGSPLAEYRTLNSKLRRRYERGGPSSERWVCSHCGWVYYRPLNGSYFLPSDVSASVQQMQFGRILVDEHLYLARLAGRRWKMRAKRVPVLSHPLDALPVDIADFAGHRGVKSKCDP
jgi:rubredoxin